MRATVLCGSGDKRGVTRSMCICASDCFVSKGIQTELFVLSDMDIRHCTDCDGCRSGSCVIEDDMRIIYDALSGSDILILASPIHFNGPSSLIKTAMDRFQTNWYNDIPHPKVCIGFLCGGSPQPNFEITERIFKAFSLTLGMEYKGSVKIGNTDESEPDVKGYVVPFLEGIL